MRCRCGRCEGKTRCGEVFLCNTRCNHSFPCGKHQCKKKCCIDNHTSCNEVCDRQELVIVRFVARNWTVEFIHVPFLVILVPVLPVLIQSCSLAIASELLLLFPVRTEILLFRLHVIMTVSVFLIVIINTFKYGVSTLYDKT